jgi:hypothetical protein
MKIAVFHIDASGREEFDIEIPFAMLAIDNGFDPSRIEHARTALIRDGEAFYRADDGSMFRFERVWRRRRA